MLQGNRLFNCTIRDNIALTAPGMPLAAVIEAARQAGARDFFVDLPEGHDTLAGEHDATLSGDWRQRIAIARALVTNRYQRRLQSNCQQYGSMP